MTFSKGELIPALQRHLEYLGETLGDEQDVRKVNLGDLAEQFYPSLTQELLPVSERFAELVFLECQPEHGQGLIGADVYWKERVLPAAKDLFFIGACIGYASAKMPRALKLEASVLAFTKVKEHFYDDEESIMEAAFTIAKTDQFGFEHGYRRIQKSDEQLKIPEKLSLTFSLRMVGFGLLIASDRVKID